MVAWNDGPPVIFVNVDGVLTSARTYWAKFPMKGSQEARVIDRAALSILAEFRARTKARVVMASAWSNFLLKSPEAWVEFFKQLGYDIPVVAMLPMPKGDRTWAEEMDEFMADKPGVEYVLFEDDPELQDHPRVVAVDAHVGLTTVNLKDAADLLGFGELADDLAGLNKSFSPEKTLLISFGGNAVEVHPRDLGKGLDALGVPGASPHQ